MLGRCLNFALWVMLPSVALAGPFTMTYEGYLTDSMSVPITGPQNFIFTIYGSSSGNSPASPCLLYTETDNSVAVTAGNVVVEVGQNLGTIHGGYSSLDKIFARSVLSGASCTFSGVSADATWTMAVSVNGTALGNVSLNAAPRAMQAQNSYSTEKIQGYTVSTAVPSNGQVLRYSGGIWSPSAETLTSESDPTVSAFAKGTTLGTGLVQSASIVSLKPCANGETLLYNTAGPSWDCTAPGGGGLSSSLLAGKFYLGNASNVATPVAMSGDATMNAAGLLTLANTSVTAGTYTSVTVDPKGRVTAGTSPIVGPSQGGTGLGAIGAMNQILGVNSSATSLEYKTLTAGTNISITPSAGVLTISATGAGDFLKDGSVPMTGDLRLFNSTLFGSSSSAGILKLESTSHATKGPVQINPNGGDVQIGAAAGSSTVGLSGTSTGFQGYKVQNLSPGVSSNSGLILGNDSSPSAAAVTVNSSSFAGLGGSGSLVLSTSLATPLVLATNNASRMIISGTGNVGIGTTSPATPLDLNGALTLRYSAGSVNVRSAPSGSTNFQFPSSSGANGYVLQTDGAGNTSWVAPSGGGLTGVTNGASGYLTTLGASAGAATPSGINNTLIGGYAGYAMTTGQANTVLGAQALYSTTTGSFNTVAGFSAGAAASNKDGNTIFGANAGNATTGDYNVIMGYAAAQGSNAGGYNVALGYGAGGASQDGTNNIAIGRGAVVSSGVNNSVVIGYGVSLGASNIVAIGNSSQTLTRLNGSTVGSGTYALSVGTSPSNGNGANLTIAGVWNNASDRRIKHDVLDLTYGLGELMRLRPVQYKMIGSDEKQIGFIAQEVYDVVPEVVVKPVTEEGRWTMSYGNLTSLAIKGIQEQQREISSLKEENSQLRAVICKYHPEEGICH